MEMLTKIVNCQTEEVKKMKDKEVSNIIESNDPEEVDEDETGRVAREMGAVGGGGTVAFTSETQVPSRTGLRSQDHPPSKEAGEASEEVQLEAPCILMGKEFVLKPLSLETYSSNFSKTVPFVTGKD